MRKVIWISCKWTYTFHDRLGSISTGSNLEVLNYLVKRGYDVSLLFVGSRKDLTTTLEKEVSI